MPSYRPVVAARRVLDVLAALNLFRDGAAVADLHRETGLDKATIVRMLETLASAGFVVRDERRALYRVTGKTLMLSASFDRHKALGAVAAPLLEELRGRVGWPSDLALYDRGEMLVIESSRQGVAQSYSRAPGFRAPILATSLGLAYLAWCPAVEREEAIEIARRTDMPWNRLSHDRPALEAELAEIRARGFARMARDYRDLEYRGRMSAIGAPVREGDRLFAAINIVYARRAMTGEDAERDLWPPLRDVAARIASDIARRVPAEG